jgi:hypothetical protein
MSILIIEVLPQGMIFAADRSVTVSRRVRRGGAVTLYQAQDVGSKILRWPHNRGLLGAVGLGEIEGRSTYDWLYDFVGDHADFSEPALVAADLRDRLQNTVGSFDPPERIIVEFGTFTKRDGVTAPEMWHVTNIHGMNEQTGEYDAPTDEFRTAEQICGVHLKDIPRNEVKSRLAACAARHDPFWFHQGINLTTFNTLERGIKQAFKALHGHGKLQPPQTLKDWERHAQMWVLIYGAYFEAFGRPGERFVGDGADVLSIPWPN